MPVMAHPFAGSWGYQVTPTSRPTPASARRTISAARRPPPPGRRRRDPRLGPRALPPRRLGARALRRHRALRARRPAPRRAPRLGDADLQPRPQRGPQLPARERALLAARQHADGLRVDAVASMLYLDYSRRPASGCPTSLAAARISRRSRSCASSTRCSTRASGRASVGGGVDRVAGRVAPDLPRRTRLRLQMEHGLDARHARLLRARPGAPPLPPPRADLQHGLRLQRELHPAALARRGRPRQGLAAREDAGRPLAALREPARAVRLHVGAPRQEAALHGQEFAQEAEWSHERSLDWHLLAAPEHAGVLRSCASSTAPTATSRRCGSGTTSRAAFAGSRPTTPPATCSRSSRGEDERRPLVCVCNLSPIVREHYRVGLPLGGDWTERINTDPASTAAATSATRRIVAEPLPWHGQPYSAELTLPPLAVLWLAPARRRREPPVRFDGCSTRRGVECIPGHRSCGRGVRPHRSMPSPPPGHRDEARLARGSVPAGSDAGTARGRTSRCSPSMPSAWSCACSTTTAPRSGSRSRPHRHNWHCYLPGRLPGSATATACSGPTSPSAGCASIRRSS